MSPTWLTVDTLYQGACCFVCVEGEREGFFPALKPKALCTERRPVSPRAGWRRGLAGVCFEGCSCTCRCNICFPFIFCVFISFKPSDASKAFLFHFASSLQRVSGGNQVTWFAVFLKMEVLESSCLNFSIAPLFHRVQADHR